MNRYLLIAILLPTLLACRQDTLSTAGEPPPCPTPSEQTSDHLPGRIRLKLTDTATAAHPLLLDTIAFRLGASRVERVFADGGKFGKRRKQAGLHRWYDFYTDPGQPASRMADLLTQLPGVEIIETVPRYRQANIPWYPFNDPGLAAQHHYRNSGTVPHSQEGADINLFPAWQKSTGHPAVIVALLDGGVDIFHPDLAPNIWRNEAEINGTEGIDDDENGYTDDLYGWRFDPDAPSGEIIPMDHGTACAGILAAVNNNNRGTAGIAGGIYPQGGIRLMCCQTFIPDPAYPDDPFGQAVSTGKTADALAYAADNGAVIASCSFSSLSLSASIREAIDYFITYAGVDENGLQTGPMRGGVVVCAAGNFNNEIPRYPAAYEKCIAVAAIYPDYTRAAYSSYGTWIDLSAPGGCPADDTYFGPEGSIHTLCPTASPNGTDGLFRTSGTSMAAPHVAGIAALVASKFGGTGTTLTGTEVRERLLGAVRPLSAWNPGLNGRMGQGLADATLALKSDDGIPPLPVNSIDLTWIYDGVTLEWEVVRDQNWQPAARFELFWSEEPLTGLDPDQPGERITRQIIENTLPVGSAVAYHISGLRETTRYYLGLAAVDEYGNRSPFNFLSGMTNFNIPPAVRPEAQLYYYFEKREPLEINLNNLFYDANDEPVSYRVSCSHPDLMEWSLTDSLLLLSPRANGLITLTITAIDPGRAVGQNTLTTMVRESNEVVDLYPNPVNTHLYLRMDRHADGEFPVRLYDTAGKKVLDTRVTIRPFEPGCLDLSAASGGLYTLQLEINGKTISRQVIKR